MSVATDQLLDVVTRFVDEEAMPAVATYDREDSYPEPLVERMRELGLFGTAIPEELPRLATGEIRGAFSITEPHAGSDVQAIKVRAVRDGDAYVVDGHKKWITNGLHAGVIMLLAVTDPDAQPRHRGFTCLVVEKEPMVHEQPGLTIPPLQEDGLPRDRLHRADRRSPVDPDQPRADGDEDPRRRAARARRGGAQGGRRARRPPGGDGEGSNEIQHLIIARRLMEARGLR
jgi:hypothetical protein